MTANADGWDPSTVFIDFSTTEWVSSLDDFRVSNTKPVISEPIEIVYYDSGAESTGITITQENGDLFCDWFESGEAMLFPIAFGNEGTYTIRAYTVQVIRDDDGNEIDREKIYRGKTITVNVSSYGTLEPVSLTGETDSIAWNDEDFILPIKNLPDAERYLITIRGELESWEDVYYTELEAGNEETIYLTIDKNVIAKPGVYRIDIQAAATGWYTSSELITYILSMERPGTQNEIILQVLDENREITTRTEWWTAESLSFRIIAPGASRIRFWNDRWDEYYPNESGYFDIYPGGISEGTHSFVAQAENSNGDGWGEMSNILTLHATRRVVPEINYSTNITEETIQRGDMIRITFGADPEIGETEATELIYSARLYTYADDGLQIIKFDTDMDAETRQILIPTDNCPAGEGYELEISASLPKWDNRITTTNLTIEEPDNTPASFRIIRQNPSAGSILIHEPVGIAFYAENAGRTTVLVTKSGDELNGSNSFETWGDFLYSTWKPETAGNYILTAYAYDENGNEISTEWDPIPVTVERLGTIGAFEPIQEFPKAVNGGEDLSLRFSAASHASTYLITMLEMIPDTQGYYMNGSWTIQQDANSNEFTVTIPANKISIRGLHILDISAQGIGYDRKDFTRMFYVLDPQSQGILRLPAGLTEIEDGAFEGGSFEAVIIPDSCTEIGAGAFSNCRNLVYVSCPDKFARDESLFVNSHVEIWDER